MTANLQARNWSISIQILDSDLAPVGAANDLGDAISEVVLTFAEPDTQAPDFYRAWTGRVTLPTTIAFEATALSLDNRDTTATPTGAALLAMGNQVDLRCYDGSSFVRAWPPLYILRTTDPLNLEDDSIRLELGDIGQLLNRITPEGDYTGIELGTTTTPHAAINNILASLGLSASPDTIATGYNLSAPVIKYNTDSRFRLIGQIAANNGYLAWFDNNEDLRLTPVDLDKTAPDVSITIGGNNGQEDANGWLKANLDDRPPEQMTVIGGGGTAVGLENPKTIDLTVPGDGYTALTSSEETNITAGGGSPNTIITYTERQAQLQIQPIIATTTTVSGQTVITDRTSNTSTGLSDSEDRTETHTYNGISGRLERTVIEIDQARGLAGGDAFRESENASALSIIRKNRITIDYEYNGITGRVKKITESHTQPWCLWEWGAVAPSNYEINRFLQRERMRITTEFSRVSGTSGGEQNERWEEKQTTLRPRGEIYPDYSGINPDTLIEDPSRQASFTREASDGSTAPPATQFQDPLYVENEQQFEATVDVTPLSGNAHKLEPAFVNASGPIVSNAQATSLCRLLCELRHGRSLGYEFAGELFGEVLSSFSPGWRIDATDTYESGVHALFLNSLAISATSTETLLGMGLGLIGTVGITPDVVSKPIALATLISTSEDLPALEDNPVAIEIETGTSNAENLPTLEDDPNVVEVVAVSNAEDLAPMEDNPVAVVVTPASNAEALPPMEDNPTATELTIFVDVELLLHFEGTNGSTTFTDSSSAARTPSVVNSGATITTSQFKFGLASGDFDGVDGAIEYASSGDFTATGDFCFEMFVRGTDWGTTDGGANRCILSLGNTLSVSNPALLLSTSGQVLLFNGSTRITSTALSLNTWYHVAWYRVSGVHYLAIDGVVDTQTYASTSTINPSLIRIGASIATATGNHEGQIDEFRYIVGQSPYGASDFTPPTGPHPDS